LKNEYQIQKFNVFVDLVKLYVQCVCPGSVFRVDWTFPSSFRQTWTDTLCYIAISNDEVRQRKVNIDMQENSPCEGTWVFVEVMSTIPSAKLRRINLMFNRILALHNQNFQSLVMVKIWSGPTLPWTEVSFVAHLILYVKLCLLLREKWLSYQGL